MSLEDILDQPVARRFVENMIARDRIPNGLLFYGPSGVGKRLLSLELAKQLMVRGQPTDSPEADLVRRRIDHGNHPDLHVVAPVKKSRIIDVEAIDNIIELASLRPYEASWRVFIIHDAERMRGPAQNHLLKTLEEPLGQSLFMLLTEYPQMLLPTIRSRCQRIRFGRLQPETVKQLLMRERDIGDAAAESVAAISQGQMSRALDLVDTGKREAVLGWVHRLEGGEEPMALAEEFAQFLQAQKANTEAAIKQQTDPADVKEMSKEDRDRLKEEQSALMDALHRRAILECLYLMETWYRDVMVVAATGDTARVLNRDLSDRLRAAVDSAAGVGADASVGASIDVGIEQKIQALEKARLYLERFLSEDRVLRDLFFALAPMPAAR